MIKYIPTHQAKCDKCGLEIIQTNVTQLQFLAYIRSLKWTVGNSVICSSCQVSKQKEDIENEKQTSIFEYIDQ